MQINLFVFLTLHQVMAMVGLGKTAVYEKIRKGGFPQAVVLGERCVRWRSDEIQAWMEAMSANRTLPATESSGGIAETTRQARAKKAVAARNANRYARVRKAVAVDRADQAIV